MAEEEQTENAEQAAATEAAGAEAPAGASGEDAKPERLSPKEIRRRKRATHSGPQGKPLTIEERVARRAAKRADNAATRRRFRAGRGARVKGGRTGTPPAVREPGIKKVSQGIVVSSKAEKTITVRVESAHRHPTYEKIIRRSKLLRAHDERNEAGEGDLVRIIESRPMSKTKRWRLTEILERAK